MTQHKYTYKSWHNLFDMRLFVVLLVVGLVVSHWRPGFWVTPSSGVAQLGQWLAPPARKPPEVALILVEKPERALWGLAAQQAGHGDDQLIRALDALTEQSKTIGVVVPHPIDDFDMSSIRLERMLSSRSDRVAETVQSQLEQQQRLRELLGSERVVLGLSSGWDAGQEPMNVELGRLADTLPLFRSWLWPLDTLASPNVYTDAGFDYFPVLTSRTPAQRLIFANDSGAYAGFALQLMHQHAVSSADRLTATSGHTSPLWRRDSGVQIGSQVELPMSPTGKVVPQIAGYSTMGPSFAHLSLAAAAARPVTNDIILVGSSTDPAIERLAATLASLAHGLVLTEPYWFAPLNKSLLLMLMLVLLLLLPRLSWRSSLFVCGAIAVTAAATQLLVQLLYGWWLPVADLLWLLILGFAVMRIWQSKRENNVEEAQQRLQLLRLTHKPLAEQEEEGGVQEEQVTEASAPRLPHPALASVEVSTTKAAHHQTLAEVPEQVAAAAVASASNNNFATTLVMELEGPLVLGRYEIQRELGRGAMGTVYLAYDPKISRKVAIKTLNFRQFEEPQLHNIKERFFREAAAAGRLNHPHIVSVFDVGEEQDLAFIAMDYVEGQPLSKFVTETHLLAPFEAYRAVANAARALHYAHQNNIIHRDIKPANIIYSAEPYQLKVTDFGIARLTDESRTSTGEILGSPLYIAPEQLQGKSLTPSVDLFSLGVTFYQLLTGQLPFSGDSLASLTYDIIFGKPQSVRKIRPDLPTSATRIVNRALQKDVNKRFESALEMAEAIEKAIRRDFASEAKATGYII